MRCARSVFCPIKKESGSEADCHDQAQEHQEECDVVIHFLNYTLRPTASTAHQSILKTS